MDAETMQLLEDLRLTIEKALTKAKLANLTLKTEKLGVLDSWLSWSLDNVDLLIYRGRREDQREVTLKEDLGR
jgi:hypothetical protein